jgi:putative ABC transport system substrate-binding protein
MQRRHFLAILGGAASSWPAAFRAHPQPAEVPVIGYLDVSGLPRLFEAFQHGLSQLGYVHGRTIMIEQRSAAGQAGRWPDLAQLARLRPKVNVASGSPAASAAKNATTTIPVVFAFATDPIGAGLVASLPRPGGNVTRQSNQAPGLVGKRLELLAEMPPGVTRRRLDSFFRCQSGRLSRDASRCRHVALGARFV